MTLALMLATFLADAGGFMVFFFIVAAVIVAVVLSAKHQKKITETWNGFAQRHNMQFNGNRAAGISGYYSGVHFRVQTITRGSGKNRSTYTQYFGYVSATMPSGLTLYKEGFFSSMGKMFGGADIQIGDAEIDRAFIIKGNDVLGVHNLLRNPHVKKALLYVIQRHPGLRIEERQILVEESGITSRPDRMEALAQDISYLAGTFNAALQQGAPTVAAPARVKGKSQPTLASIARPAATADILQASVPNVPPPRPEWHTSAASNVFDQSNAPSTARGDWQRESRSDAFDRVAAPPPVARRADPEDQAAKRAAMAEMLGGFKALEGQLQGGQRVPEQPNNVNQFAARDARDDAFAVRDSAKSNADAFAAPRNDDAFANPVPYQSKADAFAAKPLDFTPAASPFAPAPDPFAPKPAAEVAKPAAKGGARTLEELIERLSDRALLSKDREDLIKAHYDRVWMLDVVIDRIDRSFGFDLPEKLRDGRTIEATLPGKDMKLIVRYPASRNAEMDKHRSGEKLSIEASLHGWDDLFKKATLDAF